jgi:integration host factor subunit beta
MKKNDKGSVVMIIKSELVSAISQKMTQLSERDVAHGITHIIDKICHALINKKRVEIRGFGAFSLHFRPSRLAHNPKTGKKLHTKPKYAVHFKAGKELREQINAMIGQPILRDDSDDN